MTVTLPDHVCAGKPQPLDDVKADAAEPEHDVYISFTGSDKSSTWSTFRVAAVTIPICQR
jgi:hypothetical protein